MKKIVYDGEYFNVKDTLTCGQVFRFTAAGDRGYYVNSLDKRCICYNDGGNAVIECEDRDAEYFRHYFDLERDYAAIVSAAEKEKGIIAKSARLGRGIRILGQSKTETLFSFIISQNNNIPRIKAIIEKLCDGIGEEKEFMGEKYRAFPTVSAMAAESAEFYRSIGLGYRADYIKRLADEYSAVFDEKALDALSTSELKARLTAIYGVGDKVANCVTLFGFRRSNSFPVDTWIEKVYREDLKGEIKDRKKISEYLTTRFGANAGYIQQYLFYYKRSAENKEK